MVGRLILDQLVYVRVVVEHPFPRRLAGRALDFGSRTRECLGVGSKPTGESILTKKHIA